ncbi:hypothetical protein [Klebsiella pneumoniae]|uniref:hypothetical protein n=1 Tax=Klebsiella pneumoniae TaxID=573 RepID=UPI00405561A6
MTMAVEKTTATLVRGKMDGGHPMTIDLGQCRTVRVGTEVTYLGVRLGKRLNLSPHMQYLGGRVAAATNNFSRIGGALWGIKFPVSRTLYQAVILGIVRYASQSWSAYLNKGQTLALRRIQRTALIRVTRSYRTLSFEAAEVLAAAIPVDLVLLEQRLRSMVRKGREEELPPLLRGRLEETPNKWKALIREWTIEEWNARWTTSTKGGTLRKYFPTVQERLRARWVTPAYTRLKGRASLT